MKYTATAATDMVFGGHGKDTLHGGAGDDMFYGGVGADRYYGGAGSDMIYADDADTVINGWLPAFDISDPTNTDNAPANDDTTGVDESTEAVNDPMAVDTLSYERLEKSVTKDPWCRYDYKH